MTAIPQLTAAVLDFNKEAETRACLESLRAHIRVPHKIVLLDNGGDASATYPNDLYQAGLCDVLIRKRVGGGGGAGQTDLFRWCDTPLSLFCQNDQIMVDDLDEARLARFSAMLDGQFRCIDLNGDQSSRGVWTDRAHLIKTDFFNSLAPFPNGGPGDDAAKWNEQYLQETFAARGYQIAHIRPALFADCGKWSVREAGDGLFRHRCDSKQIWILRQPTYRTEVYPPFSESEWQLALAGKWVDGTIPEAWRPHSFEHWKD